MAAQVKKEEIIEDEEEKPKNEVEEEEEEEKPKSKSTPSKKRKAEQEESEDAPAKKKRMTESAAMTAPEQMEPNKVLFVENLPKYENEEEKQKFQTALEVLFQNSEGYKAVRIVPGNKGLAFADFGDETQATDAMQRLQGWNFFQKKLRITFAKK